MPNLGWVQKLTSFSAAHHTLLCAAMHALIMHVLVQASSGEASEIPLTWSCGAANKTNCSARPGAISHSQVGEDMSLVQHVFCDVCTQQRTYLEIGALDGLKYSNTLMLERGYNWGGLLIEGLPQNAQALIAHRRKSGRNVIFNEAICSSTGTVNFTDHPNSGTAGVPELMSETYLKSWGKRFKAGWITVPCRPISELIRLAGIRDIDFFSLDVEGAELLVLQTFDWTVRVKVFCIELMRGAEFDSQVRKLMHEHDYVETTAFRLGSNAVFIHGSLNRTLSSRIRHCKQSLGKRPCEQPHWPYSTGEYGSV